MSMLDDRDTDPAPEYGRVRRSAMTRARAAVVSTLAVLGMHLVGLARRHGPRLLRLFDRARREVGGLLVASVLTGLLWVGPLTRAWVTSPRWEMLLEEALERLHGWRPTAAAAALAALSWLVGPFSLPGALLGAPAVVCAAVRAAAAVYPHTVRGRVRLGYGAQGWAGSLELHRHLSAHAVREVAANTRASLSVGLPPTPEQVETRTGIELGRGRAAAVSASRALAVQRLPVGECGTWLGRSAVGPTIGTTCWAAHRDVIGLIAPPQTGKTALLGHHILDHVGAVLSTSTKTELYTGTAAVRALRGRVSLFNPERLGGHASTIRWSPVRGCADPRVATARATHLVGADGSGSSSSSGEDGRWDEWAIGVLAALLMAADVAGRDMREVASWVFNQAAGAQIALRLLREVVTGTVPELVVDALSQVTATEAKRTRDAIFLTLRSAVGFMQNPEVAAICCPADDDEVFDVAEFITGRGTVYVVGSDEGQVAPLLAAFTGYLFDTAKALAAGYPRERLDPPLMLALDEAALITPVPLQRWLADAGGRGIHIVWAVQSPSQLVDTWGAQGARTILNCTNIVVVYGGLKDDDDLSLISSWAGTRLELVPDPDGPTTESGGSGHARFERRPVCPPERVRTIPAWHALLVHRATPATLVRITGYWTRRDVRRAGRPALSTTDPGAVPGAGPGVADDHPDTNLG